MSFFEVVNDCLSMLNPEFCWFIALSLLHTIWQVALLALIVAVLVRLKFPRSPHQRFAFQFGVLLLVGSLPFANYLWMASSHGAPEPVQLARQQFLDGHLKLFPVEELAAEIANTESQFEEVNIVTLNTVSQSTVEPTFIDEKSAASPAWRWPIVFTVVGTIFYLAGALAMLFKLGWSLFARHGLSRFKKQLLTADTVPSALPTAFERAADSLGRNLRTPLLLFSGAGAAMVVGVFRPVILVNVALLSGLTPRQLEQILAHELAHVIRWDPLTLLVQRIVESLLFFHPAVWYISRQVSTSREICCDDMVARSYQSVDYAQTLMACLSISKVGSCGDEEKVSSFSLAAMGTTQSQFATRIQTLLEIDSHHISRMDRFLNGKVIAVALAFCVTVAAILNWGTSSEIPNAGIVPVPLLRVADNEWSWQSVEPGSVERASVMFNGHDLELQAKIPEDVVVQAMVSPQDCQFGQWQFGDLASKRVAILAEFEEETIVRVYVDINRNRVIEESEEVRTKLDFGNSWILDLDVEVNEDDQVIHMQRQIAISQKRKRGLIKISTLGFATGEVTIGDQQFKARRLDVNGNGLPTDRVDKLWIDFDQDGSFEPVAERLNLSATLDHDGHRFAIHSDRIGHTLKFAPADEQGLVKFLFELEDSSASIDSLEGSLRDESGMVIAIRLSEEPIEIPVGRYCISNLVVCLRDADDVVWRMSLTRGFDLGWFEVNNEQLHTVELLKSIQLYASVVRENNKYKGTEFAFQPQFYTENGLVITDLQQEQSDGESIPFSGPSAKFKLNNLHLPESKPQSCSSGFA